MNYDNIIKTDNLKAKIVLDKEQQAMILALHDLGVKALNRDNVHVLYSIIADLKKEIHK